MTFDRTNEHTKYQIMINQKEADEIMGMVEDMKLIDMDVPIVVLSIYEYLKKHKKLDK